MENETSFILFSFPRYENVTFSKEIWKDLSPVPSSGTVLSSLYSSITFEIRLAEAAHLVYITNIRESDIIAIEISVKYCINAITVVAEEVLFATKYALNATTATIPIFISRVIIGFTIPIIVPARVSFCFNFKLALSYRAFS